MSATSHDWWQRVLTGPAGTLVVGDEDGSAERYAALPRANSPRVVVDVACRVAMSDALERMASSRSSNSTVRSMASSLSPLVSRRKADWSVRSPDPVGTLRSHLSEILGVAVQLSVAVGPPRPNLKPIVRCYNDDRLVAVAKLGPDSHTKKMVENETVWLSALMESPLPEVVTPEVLHDGSFGDSALLVTAPLDLVDDLGVTIDEMPNETLREFLRSRVHEGASVSESAWWAELGDRLGDERQPLFNSAISQVIADPFFAALEVSAWHGDWSPWNTGRTSDGRLAIWDWERATSGVPTGLDALHLHYQYGSGFGGATLELAEQGIPQAHHRLLHIMYLLEVCARHNEAGALDTPRHKETEETLRRMLDDWA